MSHPDFPAVRRLIDRGTNPIYVPNVEDARTFIDEVLDFAERAKNEVMDAQANGTWHEPDPDHPTY